MSNTTALTGLSWQSPAVQKANSTLCTTREITNDGPRFCAIVDPQARNAVPGSLWQAAVVSKPMPDTFGDLTHVRVIFGGHYL